MSEDGSGAYRKIRPVPTWLMLAAWGLGIVNLSDGSVQPFWWDLLILGSFLWLSYALVDRYRQERPAVVQQEPAAGPCTVTWVCESFRSSFCGLPHGHLGAHKDPDTGMVWWLTGDTIPRDDYTPDTP